MGPLQALGSTRPWLIFYPAVILAAILGGLSAGLLATALGCVAVLWPMIASGTVLRTDADWLGMLVFIVTGVTISFIGEARRATKARVDIYDNLVKSMDEGFCVVEMIFDADGRPVDYRFLECNPAFEAHTGLLEAKEKTMREMVPDHDEHWFELFGRVARTGEEIRFENPATAMKRFYDVFAFRVSGDGSNRVGILFNDITERKKNEQDLMNAALHDKLTDLPNRAMFREYLANSLARAERSKRPVALLFLDLNGFKEVNDTLGHQAGDELLRQVALRLKSSVRGGDFVSRFGGDEFTMVLDNCPPNRLAPLAENILKLLELPIDLDGQEAQISASIGIVTYPECGTDEETLVRRADAAMYDAKKEGKSGYKVWEP